MALADHLIDNKVAQFTQAATITTIAMADEKPKIPDEAMEGDEAGDEVRFWDLVSRSPR